ncbi:1684_t:CDS:1, partial [Gigaspora rosea]
MSRAKEVVWALGNKKVARSLDVWLTTKLQTQNCIRRLHQEVG